MTIRSAFLASLPLCANFFFCTTLVAGKSPSAPFTITILKNKGASARFKITNVTKKAIELPTQNLYSDNKLPYDPAFVEHEYLKAGKWHRTKMTEVGFSDTFRLKAGGEVTFETDLSDFKWIHLRKGTIVRIWIGGVPSEPFRWQGSDP